MSAEKPQPLPADRRFMVDGDWEQLIAEHQGAVRAVLRGLLKSPEDVEDCCQNTFLTAIARIEAVSVGARRAWLIQVARNKALELIRRGKIGKGVLAQISDREAWVDLDDPLEQVLSAEMRGRVQQAIDLLPEPQRQILKLRIHEGITFQAIAQQLGIPLGTALTRMRLAIETLKQIINRDS